MQFGGDVFALAGVGGGDGPPALKVSLDKLKTVGSMVESTRTAVKLAVKK